MKNKLNKNSKEIYEEEKIEINNIKPMTIIEKPDKNDFYKINKNDTNFKSKNIPQELSTNNRKKAYNLMKQDNSKLNNINLPAELDTQIDKKFPVDNNKKRENESPLHNPQLHNPPSNSNFNKNPTLDFSLTYALGANLNLASSNFDESKKVDPFNSHIDKLICFHKKEKWVAYLNNNLIIIEYFDQIKCEDLRNQPTNLRQKILNNISSKYYLNCVKLSENGKILMAYSKQGESIIQRIPSSAEGVSKSLKKETSEPSGPIILFYNYRKNTEDKDEFLLINRIIIKHSHIISCEVSHQSNICLVLSNILFNKKHLIGTNKRDQTFVSLLDFHLNEILTTTVIDVNYLAIKWNPYLTNFEFSSLADRLYTFWRFNTNEVTLQYQHGESLDKSKISSGSDMKFTCMDFTPPLGEGSVILLLIAVDNGELWGVDTRTNSVNVKYTLSLSLFPEKNFLTEIVCSLRYISLICANRVIVLDIINSKDTNYTEILHTFSKLYSHDRDTNSKNLLNLNSTQVQPTDFSTIELDSDIISYDSDLISSDAISLTKKGSLFCISTKEKFSFRLFSFIENKSIILQAKIISKDIANQSYKVRNINFDELHLEEMYSDNEFKANQYLLITSHKFGVIKIWSIPQFQLLSNFEVCTEEILTFDVTTNDAKLAVSYSSNYLRIFDFAEDKFLGKFSSISNSSYKILKFLQDKFFLYAVDMNNTLFLIRIENYKNLIVQVHQIINLGGDVIDFKLNIVESYNKFLVNLQNVYLHVYNRKFTNILKNSTYDNSIPIFYLQDKFNPNEYFKLDEDAKIQTKNKLEEFFKFEFSPNERDLVIIMSHARGVILIRNFELHTIEKIVKTSNLPLNFLTSPNFNFVIFVYQNKIRLNEEFSEYGKDFELVNGYTSLNTGNKSNCCVSSNGIFFVIFIENKIYFYNISEKI